MSEDRARQGSAVGIQQARPDPVSPSTLFASAGSGAAAIGRSTGSSDLESGVRLSFFLWSSIPDEELVAGAERATANPDILERRSTDAEG